MTTEEFEQQRKLADIHAKAGFEAIEQAQVHFMIEDILRNGLEAQDKYEYKQESLNNLAQSLTN